MKLKMPSKLFHYSRRHIKKLQPRPYLYHPSLLDKPKGLWFSVEDFSNDTNWFDFWSDMHGAENRLRYKHQITLHPNSPILYISNAMEFDIFEERFMLPNFDIYATLNQDGTKKFSLHEKTFQQYEIDWCKVSRNFAGIIIAPYLWERRMNDNRSNWHTNWYYGWNCASGCIWNLRCIKSFEMVEKIKIPRKKRKKKT